MLSFLSHGRLLPPHGTSPWFQGTSQAVSGASVTFCYYGLDSHPAPHRTVLLLVFSRVQRGNQVVLKDMYLPTFGSNNFRANWTFMYQLEHREAPRKYDAYFTYCGAWQIRRFACFNHISECMDFSIVLNFRYIYYKQVVEISEVSTPLGFEKI